MRVPLLYPFFPKSFWPFEKYLELFGANVSCPPLDLIASAVILYQVWELLCQAKRIVNDKSGLAWYWANPILLFCMNVPSAKRISPYPNYQIPKRSLRDFCEREDSISFDIISPFPKTSVQKPELWNFLCQDNKKTIFRQNDLRQRLECSIFGTIVQINSTETQILYENTVKQYESELVNTDKWVKWVKAGLELTIQPLPILFTKLLKSNTLRPFESVHYKRTLLLGASLLVASLNMWLFLRPITQLRTQEVITHSDMSRLNSPIESLTREALIEQYKNRRRDFRKVNLTGVNLSNLNLSEIDFSDSILESVDLHQTDLTRANLKNVMLAKANLRGTILNNVNLTDANLSEANLMKANLTNAVLLRAELKKANLSFAILLKADLMRANLREADLEMTDLRSANLMLANLLKVNLFNAKLRDSNLGAANLTQTSLNSADLAFANLRSAELYLTNLSNANLSSANLSSANLVLVKLTGANLRGVNFRNTIVSNVNSIQDADFTDVINLSFDTRKYLCANATGTFLESNTLTKVTLGCP